jgi:hypothetical protein
MCTTTPRAAARTEMAAESSSRLYSSAVHHLWSMKAAYRQSVPAPKPSSATLLLVCHGV